MEIQSAFNSGVQGLQKANEEVTESAREIARETLASEQNEPPSSSSTTSSLKAAETATSGLTDAIVNLKVAEVQARASTDVIKTADENLGTLLDVRV